jgi:hypothetical protein
MNTVQSDSEKDDPITASQHTSGVAMLYKLHLCFYIYVCAAIILWGACKLINLFGAGVS